MIANVIAFLQIIVRVLASLVRLIALSVKPRRSLEAENLFLRKQPANPVVSRNANASFRNAEQRAG
jgi:hypothetical protein